MQDIADRAGVAVQTTYFSFRTACRRNASPGTCGRSPRRSSTTPSLPWPRGWRKSWPGSRRCCRCSSRFQPILPVRSTAVARSCAGTASAS
ncbi:MAG: hypothetical protein ACT4O0_15600 [Pseudonocardia sp.]